MSATSYESKADGDLLKFIKTLYSRESLEREDHLKITYLSFDDVFDGHEHKPVVHLMQLLQSGFGALDLPQAHVIHA